MKRIFCLLLVSALSYLIIDQLVSGAVSDRDDASPVLLPEPFLDLGSGGSYALFVSKSECRIDVYQKLADNSIVRLKSFRTSTGQVEGDKFAEGDLKTPEGIYYLVRIREQKELLQKYGIRAFDLNYPNLLDQLEAKTGYGIWLHGTDEPERLKEPRTSEGCIVVHNDDLKTLSDYITLYRTPIVIADKFTYQSPPTQSELRNTIQSFILSWLDSWATQDFERYSGFYNDSFRAHNRGLKSWLMRKRNVFSQTLNANIEIADLKILKDGSSFLVSFIQHYRSNLMDDTGIKWVYLQNSEQGFRIVGEEWYPLSKAVRGNHWNVDTIKFSLVVDDLEEVELDRMGKAVLMDPQFILPLNPPTKVADAKTSGESADLSPAGVAETSVETPAIEEKIGKNDKVRPVSVEQFKINDIGEVNLTVHFKLVNALRDDIKKRGRLFLVASWSGEDEYTSFPEAALVGGYPVSASEGDIYGIRWFKEVTASLKRPNPKAQLLELRCFLFDRKDLLISDFQLYMSKEQVD